MSAPKNSSIVSIDIEPAICKIPDLQKALKILDTSCQEGKCDFKQLRAIESNRKNLVAILGNRYIGLIHIFFPAGRSGVRESYNWKTVSTQLKEKYHAKYYAAYIIGRASDVGIHFDNVKLSKERALHVLGEMKQQLTLVGVQNIILKPAWLGKDIFQLTQEDADVLNIPTAEYQNSKQQADIRILNQSVEILFMPCREQYITKVALNKEGPSISERPLGEITPQPNTPPPNQNRVPIQPRPSSTQRLNQPRLEVKDGLSSQKEPSQSAKETSTKAPRDAAQAVTAAAAAPSPSGATKLTPSEGKRPLLTVADTPKAPQFLPAIKPHVLPAVKPHVEHEPTDQHNLIPMGRPAAILPEVVAIVPHSYDGRDVSLSLETKNAYEELLAHARAAGFLAPLFNVVSGFRSDETQQRLWEQALKSYKTPEEARKWVAKPGYSKHRSGRAIDLYLGKSCRQKNVGALREEKAYQWMVKHGPEFGFNPYSAEPWHWEYNAR